MCVDYEILFSSNKLPAGLLVQAAAAAQRSLDISRLFAAAQRSPSIFLPDETLFYPTKCNRPSDIQKLTRRTRPHSNTSPGTRLFEPENTSLIFSCLILIRSVNSCHELESSIKSLESSLISFTSDASIKGSVFAQTRARLTAELAQVGGTDAHAQSG